LLIKQGFVITARSDILNIAALFGCNNEGLIDKPEF